MKILKNKKIVALALFCLMGNAYAENKNSPDKKEIQDLIATTYDKPEAKVITHPIVIEETYALADWVQGKKGGRALLKKMQSGWQIIACGGDGFKDANQLHMAGISKSVAKSLVLKLGEAEQSLNPDLLKQFGLFGNDKDPAKHHENNHEKHSK